MKIILRVVVASLLYLSSISVVSATFIYTVEGDVTGIYGNGPSVNVLGLSRGDKVSYQFLVNTERPGFVKYADNSINHIEDDITPDWSYIRFYAELLNISYIVNETYYNFGMTNYLAENVDDPTFSSLFGRVVVGPDKLYFDSSAFIEDWQLGDSVFSSHWWHDSITGEFITLHSQLNITELVTVPLPSSLLLLASAFTALFSLSRRGRQHT